jgi:hypothetical protein
VARRNVDLTSLVLVIHVPGNASGCRARERMMASIMPGNATDERAANAAFGVHRRGRYKGRWNSQRKGHTKSSHL